MIATVDNPSNAAEWVLAEMVNRLVSLLSVLPQLKFWASYATGPAHSCTLLDHILGRSLKRVVCNKPFYLNHKGTQIFCTFD